MAGAYAYYTYGDPYLSFDPDYVRVYWSRLSRLNGKGRPVTPSLGSETAMNYCGSDYADTTDRDIESEPYGDRDTQVNHELDCTDCTDYDDESDSTEFTDNDHESDSTDLADNDHE